MPRLRLRSRRSTRSRTWRGTASWSRRYIEMLTDHRRPGGNEDLPEVRMEMFVGTGHHVSGEELEQGDADSLRERLDGLIEMFEPEMPSPAG